MGLDLEKLKTAVLNADDFAHELKVGAVPLTVQHYLNIEEKTEHAGTYTDSSTGKPRQFDYRFRFLKKSSTGHTHRGIFIAAECKNIRTDSPLLVSGLERRIEESGYSLIESGYNVNMAQTIFNTSSFERNKSFYPPGEFVGKSLLRPKLKKELIEFAPDSDVYERWAQALSSAIELADDALLNAAPPPFYR